MWGSYLLDIYGPGDVGDMRDAIEAVLGATSGSTWATGGVYLFWHPVTREPLYVGITGDLAVRFAQHHGLRSCQAKGCKREQTAAFFADEHETLGYTIIPLSSLSQPDTARVRSARPPEVRRLYAADTYFADEAIDEIRALEGRLLAYNKVRFGHLPRWNTSPGRLPEDSPAADDGTLATAVGALDILLQARKTIRQLAENPTWAMFEEHLHGVRLVAVARGIVFGQGVRNDIVRQVFDSMPVNLRQQAAIREDGYLDERNPLTIGPIAEPPPE